MRTPVKSYTKVLKGAASKGNVVEAFHFEENFKVSMHVSAVENRVKMFKLSRLRKVKVLKSEWAFEGWLTVPAMDSFRSHGDLRVHVVLDLDETVIDYMEEFLPKTFTDVMWRYEGTESSVEGIGRFCLLMEDHVRFIEGERVGEVEIGRF